MIIVGEGALFTRAIRHCLEMRYPLHALISRKAIPARLLQAIDIPVLQIPNVNDAVTFIQMNCFDGLVWSINNPTVLKTPLLDLPGIRFFNIHNGLVQSCRGLPEISIFFSVLCDEDCYGITLHQIDQGIDTGPVIAQQSMAISSEDTFETVMNRTLEMCATMFEEQCPRILAGEDRRLEINKIESQYYNYRMLSDADSYKTRTSWPRAIQLGKYRAFFPRLAAWIETG